MTTHEVGTSNTIEFPTGRRILPRRRRPTLSGGRLFLVFVAAVLLYLAFSVAGQFSRLHALQREVTTLQAELEELQEKNRELRRQVEMVQSDTYVEKVAREKLGLIKPGEKRIIQVEEPAEKPQN